MISLLLGCASAMDYERYVYNSERVPGISTRAFADEGNFYVLNKSEIFLGREGVANMGIKNSCFGPKWDILCHGVKFTGTFICPATGYYTFEFKVVIGSDSCWIWSYTMDFEFNGTLSTYSSTNETYVRQVTNIYLEEGYQYPYRFGLVDLFYDDDDLDIEFTYNSTAVDGTQYLDTTNSISTFEMYGPVSSSASSSATLDASSYGAKVASRRVLSYKAHAS